VGNGLLIRKDDGETLSRVNKKPEAVLQLNVLAHSLLQTIHRYLISISILAKYGSGVLSRAELEKLCIQTAQRISMLHEFNAPEFYEGPLQAVYCGNAQNRLPVPQRGKQAGI